MSSDLATLVGSRICHDLISPIGAISNGVELLGLTDGSTGAEMALIQQSVDNAASKIKFFRIAYGTAKSGQLVGQAEIGTILRALAENGRLSYDWQVAGDQPRPLVRCAFLTLLVIETALPLGGEITISQTDSGFQFVAKAKRLALDQAKWDGLQTRIAIEQHDAAHVQFALLPPLLSDLGRTLRYHHDENALTVTF